MAREPSARRSRVLTRQLERRFGRLSEAARTRLAHAEVTQLDAWSERVLDAATLDDVLR